MKKQKLEKTAEIKKLLNFAIIDLTSSEAKAAIKKAIKLLK